MMAVGEYTKASGKDLLTALILGDDMVARLIGSVGFNVYDCFDGNGTSNCMGATAVAAKLMGLDAEKINNAFAMALNMTGGSMENVFQGAWAFKLPIALSARNAIIAAEMAEKGCWGVTDPINGTRCFLDMYGADNRVPENFIDELGKIYYGDIVVKPWPSCHGTQYAIDAALEITEGKPYKPEEIDKIILHVSPGSKGFVGQDFEFGNTNQPSGAFSMRFTVATAILRGILDPASYTPEAMTDPELGKMLAKLDIETDGPKKGANVEIRFANGETKFNEVNESLGHMRKKPFTDEMLHEKFVRNVKFGGAIELARAEEAYQMALHLDELDGIQPIIDILAGK